MRLSLLGPLHPFRGGIAHHTMMLAQTLHKKHNLQLITFKRQFPSLLYPGATDRDPSKQFAALPAERILSPYNPFCWRQAANQIREHGSQAAVLQWWSTFWAPGYSLLSRSLQRARIPVVYLVHNVFPHEQRSFDPFLARMALKQGDSFLVHGEELGQRLQRLIPDAEIVTSPHPPYAFFPMVAKSKHEEGLSAVDAALEATHIRFRPVLMTAFSFIIGVIPLAIATGAGAASRHSLGTTVLGGMTASTFLSLGLVPVFYVVIMLMKEHKPFVTLISAVRNIKFKKFKR